MIAQQYITFSWNYASGTVLQKNQVIEVTVTITANQYIAGVEEFNNNLYIIATKAETKMHQTFVMSKNKRK